MEITSVKLQSNGWMLNGTMSVPDASGNRERELIKQWLEEGNTPEPEFTDAELLDNAKEAKRTQVRNAFEVDSNSPVVVNTISYHGGFDSAIKLDAVKRLSEALGATEVTFFDTTNVGHILSLVDAQDVITQVAGKYQMDFATKQAKMVAIDTATTIQEVEVV